MTIYVGLSIDWPAWITAIATAILTAGIFFAARQLRQDRLFNRVSFVGEIFRRWNRNRYWDARTWMEKSSDLEQNRQRVNRVWQRIKRLSAFKRYRETKTDIINYVSEISLLAERIELYIARGIIDMDLVANHIGYDVITIYYYLQDVFEERTSLEDENHEGIRDLALRIQHYARLHFVDIRDEVIWAVLPPLRYAGGDESEGYPMSRFYRWRLKQARLRFMRET